MLNQYFRSFRVKNRMERNILGTVLKELADYLGERGHALPTLHGYMQAAEHFGNWLRMKKIPTSAVEKEVVEEFLRKHLPHCQCPPPANKGLITNRAALKHLLDLMRAKRAVAIQSNSPDSPIETELKAFKLYLENTCGVARNTCRQRLRYVGEFLFKTFGCGLVDAHKLQPSQLMQFLARRAKGYTAGTAQVMASALRSYLRFLQLSGRIDRDLIKAVPIIPRWSLATIPKTMTAEQSKRLLQTFNQETTTGRRDYAMALCMLDLGMRADEVSQLRLEDVNWRESTILITRRKTCRSGVLPLTHRCGQAIANYLRRDRGKMSERRLFLSHRAPVGRPIGMAAVYSTLVHAFKRAGLKSELKGTGTRILRHTMATRMHQQGATLKEVADVLGHRSIDTTAIYAKVNLPMLEQVALPWPEEATPCLKP